MNKNIATVSLKEFTHKETSVFHYVAADNNEALYQKAAHRRNDHFLFIFQKNGQSKIVVDFREVELHANSFICILPGQVHYTASVKAGTEAWLMTTGTAMLNKKQRSVFEENYFNYQPIIIEKPTGLFINECLELFVSSQNLHIAEEVGRSLANASISLFAQVYQQAGPEQVLFSRKHIITKQFKHLLLRNFKAYKTAADFAGQLHISPSYLSEAVKATTGFTVSYWAQQMVMTEAKRLLYATEKTVKEIAHELGFDDPAYFNRYFSNAEKVSPLQFRKGYRE